MPDTPKPSVSVWIGRAISTLVVIALLADGATALFAPEKIAGLMQETGFAMNMLSTLGIVMLVCAVLYAIPATTVLGAILVTGFFGGAICTHVRLGELGSPPQIVCLVLGVLAWGGLYLRDPRIRALMPITR